MKKLKTLLALFVVAVIPFILMIWIRVHQNTGFATKELILYPLLFGGSSIIVLVLLKKFFLHEKLLDFSSGKGSLGSDILWSLVLTASYFTLFFLDRLTLANWLQFRPNEELLGLMLDLRESPGLLLIWFGPVLWLGIASYEELIRVFMLDSLWKFGKKKIWIALVILLSAALIGLTHWSQGPYGIVSIGIKSIVSGFFFYKRRRLFPLILAHVLYDGIQVALLLVTYPS